MAELIFPSSPAAGDLFPDPALPGVSQWIWDGSRWNLVQGGASVTVSNTPPGNPNNGDLWFDAENLKLFVWYDDGATAQWVVANPSGGGGGDGGWPAQGVTDGSNAQPGEVGEIFVGVSTFEPLTVSQLAHVEVPPGDWDIHSAISYFIQYTDDRPMVDIWAMLTPTTPIVGTPPVSDPFAQIRCDWISGPGANMSLPVYRASLTETTTFSIFSGYELLAGAVGSTSNKSAFIRARRMR